MDTASNCLKMLLSLAMSKKAVLIKPHDFLEILSSSFPKRGI